MTNRQIADRKQKLADAGRPADRRAVLVSMVSEVRDDLAGLDITRSSTQAQFRRFLSSWLSDDLPADVPVRALAEDVHDGRIKVAGAIVATSGELGLAAWVFERRLEISPLIGIASAVVLTWVLHSALHWWYDLGRTDRPKEAVRRLKAGPFQFGLIGFAFASVLLILSRYVEGRVALYMLPWANFGLAVATMSLMVLAACLFCAAGVDYTTLRFEKRFRALDDEHKRTHAFLEELLRDAAQGGGPDHGSTAAAESRPNVPAPSAAPQGVSGLVLLAALAAGSSACTAASAEQAPTTSSGAVCEVVVDTSGSVATLQDGWRHIRAELPSIVEASDCESVTVYRMEADGWALHSVVSIPVPRVSRPAKASRSELEDLKTFRDAVAEENEKERNEAFAAYRAAVEESLKAVDMAPLLPADSYESTASDAIGTLRRFSQVRSSQPYFVLFLTDFADTRYREFPKIESPPGNVQLVVLVAPAKPKDAERSLGRSMKADEQFEYRSRQLSEAAPWVRVVPYFAPNLAKLFH